MAFADSFHEIAPGYRINGRVMVFAIMTTKDGGVCDGQPILDIGSFGIPGRSFVQAEEGDRIPSGMNRVDDVAAIYEKLELSGMSTVIPGILVNPSAVALLEYDDDTMIAEAQGPLGKYEFQRANVPVVTRYKDTNKWLFPSVEFDSFKELALQRLTTIIDVAAQASNAYIHFDGSNDYVEFTGTSTGLMDWTADWTIGINLVEFEVKSDQKFITLFKSGDNAIMLRRGGANHGLYLTGNDGANKAGVNTWYAPNPGGKLLFVNDGSAGFLKYYIGNVDGTFALRGVVNIASATGGNNSPGTEFCIGKKVGSNAVAESLYYPGGLNNFIYADEAFANASPMISEYFGVNNAYDQASFYGDLNSWVKMGEDTYPNVVDTLGALTGGSLINGTEEDFVEITED